MLSTFNSIKKLAKDLPFSLNSHKKLLGQSKLSHSDLMKEIAQTAKCPTKNITAPALIVELVRVTIDIHRKVADFGNHDEANKLSILAGDYFFSKALSFIPKLKNTELEKIIFEQISNATYGDLLKGMVHSQNGNAWQSYMNSLKLSVGSLYALCFIIPFHTQKTNKKKTELLHTIGVAHGVLTHLLLEYKRFKKNPTDFFVKEKFSLPLFLLTKLKIKSTTWLKNPSSKKNQQTFEHILELSKEVILKEWEHHISLIHQKHNLSDKTLNIAITQAMSISENQLRKLAPFNLPAL